jgi:tetratricopeptide (TPR) repeat protein
LREEAASWAEEIVDAARAVRHRRLIYLLTWAGSSAWSVGRMEDAKRFGNEAVALLDHPGFDLNLWAYSDLATIALIEGNLEEAITLIRKGAEHPIDHDDRFCLASLLFVLAAAQHYDEAMSIADKVTAAADATGVPCTISLAYFAKSEAFAYTDAETALGACEHALRVALNSGNRLWAMMASSRVAGLQVRIGNPIAALRGYRQMFHAGGRAADHSYALIGLAGLTLALQLAGEPAAAATLYGFVSPRLNARSLPEPVREGIDALQHELGASAFAETMNIGAAMTQPEVERYAVEQIDKALAKLEGSGAP